MPEMNMDPEIIAVFREQAGKYITAINNNLVALEKEGPVEDLYKQIKAVLHTLKGDSRMLGLSSISVAAHRLEDVFMPKIGEGKAQSTSPDEIAFVYKVLDRISSAVEKLPEIIEVNVEVNAGSPGPVAAEKDTATEARFTTRDLSQTGEQQATELFTLDIRKIEELIGMSSIFPRYSSRLSFIHTHMLGVRDELGDRANGRNEKILKNFDALLYELGHELSFFDLQSRQFQDEITRLKLVTLKSLFDQFPRLVRDVAQATGKDVNFVMQGQDVELEKIVVDNLKPILIHLLRNAVDHGCQTGEERTALGKPGGNRVLLKAFNQGDNVIIEISDDGKGLDIPVIKRTAMEKGYLSAENAEKLSDETVISYIFESGFSTKELGDFSGRGVGMDVVAQTVKSLNGEINVRTLSGKGTTFSITLPLFSSYIPVTLFTLSGILYGIPSVYIQSAVPYVRSQVNLVGEKTALIRTAFGEVSLVDLGTLFGFPRMEAGHTPIVLIVRYKDNLVSLVIDEIVLEKKLIIRKPSSFGHLLKIIIGAVLLGKERAIPVLNIPELFGEFLHRDITFVQDRHYLADKQKFGAKTVLLVEDSPVTRLREKQILQNQNLNVVEAANGREALDVLAAQEVHLVITDLEMPVMNGRELVKACKASETYKNLPIIVVSSYDNLAEEVFSLGINYFINKAEFSAELLINVLRGQKIL